MLEKIGKHQHIISLQDYYRSNDHWILILDLAKGGELFQYIVDQVGNK